MTTSEAQGTYQVRADRVQPGMVLVDVLTGEDAVEIDHKMRTERNSGLVRYLGLDYSTGRYEEVRLTPSHNVTVRK
jgi:hypothetical protein